MKVNLEGFETMSQNASELGLSGVVDVIRRLLVEEFGIQRRPDQIEGSEELFEKGLGLTSLQGLTLLLALEEEFALQVDEMGWSIHEKPTVDGLAAYFVRLADVEKMGAIDDARQKARGQ
jgi:acyl carrier protein